MHLCLDLVPALQELAGGDADPIVLAAFEAIHRHAFLIRSKLSRALSGSWRVLERAMSDEDDDDDVDGFERYDADGSAHVAWRAIAESRAGWEVVTVHPRFASHGVAAAMVRRLADLEAAVAGQFPGARSFRRPGFD
jgi:hypothetical protein